MRQVSDTLAAILDGGQVVCHLELDAFYGADRTIAGVPVDASWQLEWDRTADVPGSGTVLAQYQSPEGESLTPKQFTDRLAPYGQEVAPRLVFDVGGGQTESVQVGRWLIDDVPTARDDQFRLIDRVVTVGSFVELTLLDPLERVRASGFTRVEKPPTGARVWSEIQRLTGMKILRRGDDPAVPSSMTYALQEGGRLEAVRELAAFIGGTPYVLADGTLTVLPNVTGAVVRRFTIGDGGVAPYLPRALSKQDIYNEIVGVFEDANRDPIVVPPAQILDGPLSINGPLGKRTRYVSSKLVSTYEGGAALLARELVQSSAVRSFQVPVDVPLDPRIEVGDTVALEQPSETFTGMVAKVTLRANGMMRLLVDVTLRVEETNLEA